MLIFPLNDSPILWTLKAQTNTAAPAVLMRVRKTLNVTQLFLYCNTYKWQAVNQHITRFPYQFQKTVIHLSVSSPPCSPLTLQLYYSTSKWGLRFHMAQYQKSTCSHSALIVTAEEEQASKFDAQRDKPETCAFPKRYGVSLFWNVSWFLIHFFRG